MRPRPHAPLQRRQIRRRDVPSLDSHRVSASRCEDSPESRLQSHRRASPHRAEASSTNINQCQLKSTTSLTPLHDVHFGGSSLSRSSRSYLPVLSLAELLEHLTWIVDQFEHATRACPTMPSATRAQHSGPRQPSTRSRTRCTCSPGPAIAAGARPGARSRSGPCKPPSPGPRVGRRPSRGVCGGPAGQPVGEDGLDATGAQMGADRPR